MKKTDFNREWIFQKLDDNNNPVGTEKIVNVPHDAMLFEDRDRDAATASAGGYFHGGKYSYIKKFTAPAEWQERTVYVELEGVYKNASVYVNGSLAVQWPYGYTNFGTELNPYLKYGEENEIQVIADNSKCPNSRWYSGSGIYREVNLYIGGKKHILKDGIRILTPDTSTVNVTVMTSEVDFTQAEITISYQGEPVATQTMDVVDNMVKASFTIEDAKTWSAETPELYGCKVELKENGETIDTDETLFGIRTISWSTKGFFVNGKETLLRGGCIHHDNGILGACNFADAEERRVRILKEAGFNAIRSSHNPISKAMLDACDRLGMYVMDESFDHWLIHKNKYDYANETFREWWKKDTEAMIIKSYNHPSVVMYSIGNEISELGLPEGQEVCKEMVDFVKGIDSSRAVTLGGNIMLMKMAASGKGLYDNESDTNAGAGGMDKVPTSTAFNILMNRMGGIMEKMAKGKKADKASEKAFSYLDIAGYNYAASRYESDGLKYPDRIIVGAETLPPTLYRNWQLVKKLPYVIGDFMWTSWDYLGEAAIGTVKYKSDVDSGKLCVLSGSGIIDICGKMRPEVEWGKSIWGLSQKPAIAVDPYTHAGEKYSTSMWRKTDSEASWSWEGCEGLKSRVIVYSDAATIELFVNGKSYGKRNVKENKVTFKRVVYEPGEIKAIAYDTTGSKVGESSLRSAMGETKVKLTPETTVLKADGQSLCFISIDLVGENDITKSSVDKTLKVSVEGAGTLQAFGSARPFTDESFVTGEYTTYRGKALAVVRAGYEKGKIEVTVSSDELPETKLSIDVEL